MPTEKEIADAIAAKAEEAPKAPQEAGEARADLDARQPTPWRVEEWRSRYIVMREVPAQGSPMMIRELHSKSKLGSSAVVFEDENAAKDCAKKLNAEEKK